MALNEADTRAKLIDPAIHKCGWTEDLIRREETAGTVGQVRLQDLGYARHFSVLKNQSIPLPFLAEQKRIAGVLHEQMTAVEKARAAVEEELTTINTLPAALLRRAFAGEL